jgi:hypothetical protein
MMDAAIPPDTGDHAIADAPVADTFIRVVEVWIPDQDADGDASLLILGGAWYGGARRFGMLSRQMCFGRGEGLPGQAWEARRPIVLKQFDGSVFRRTAAAHAEGLSCGIALPVFDGDTLKAVVLIFCGDDDDRVGAIELWRNRPAQSRDLLLDDGCYGATAEAFEFIARRTAFRKGTGLPGIAWETGLPVFLDDLGKGGRFLRADGARKVGINRGFAIPCAAADGDVYVMAFLSALATPIVRRFESWLPADGGSQLLLHEGFCESAGAWVDGQARGRIAPGDGAIGRAFSTGVPTVGADATNEPGPVGAQARAAGLRAIIALPVWQSGRVTAVVAWYF